MYAITYPNAIDNAIISASNELNFVATEELNCVMELIDIPPTTTSPKEPVDTEEPLTSGTVPSLNSAISDAILAEVEVKEPEIVALVLPLPTAKARLDEVKLPPSTCNNPKEPVVVEEPLILPLAVI